MAQDSVSTCAREARANHNPEPGDLPRVPVPELVIHLREGPFHVDEARQEHIDLGKARSGSRKVPISQVTQAGCPNKAEVAVARPRDLRPSKESADITGRNEEVETLPGAGVRAGMSDEGEDAHDRTDRTDHRPSAVPRRRGSIGLDHVLPD